MDKELDKILKKVEKPARYIGGEVNSIKKDPADVSVRVGFAFPDTYEIGMSYMGMQILYNILNKNPQIYCERLFAPAVDMETIMREENRKLFTLETFTPIDQLDIVAFTLQYEMAFTNILNMLDLGGVPVKSCDRGEDDPVVMAGGPCAYNPEPLADFIDLFMIGDGEELFEKVALMRRECSTREEYLQRCSQLDGVYVPSFYDVKYNEDGTVKEYVKLYDKAPDRVKRAVIADLDSAEFPTSNIVPFIDTVHDRAVVETFRGCTRGCRFCQAGMIYRPVRERKPDTIKEIVKKQLKNTGHEELSLLSLSTSDYSRFEDLAMELMGMCKAQNVSLSLPSLRLDSFSFNVLNEIQGYRKSGLTFAPEAGSQRLRDVINKNITEEDIYSAVEQAIELGWETIKLYFMDGLPGETFEDLDGIAEIAKNILDINFKIRGRKGGRFRVTVSVSNFVPKAHTPFQWAGQDRPEMLREKHNYLSERLHVKGITFNYHETETSNLEAIIARGDRKVGNLIYRAWQLGCKFDAWTEHHKGELWQQAMEETGVTLDFYAYRERSYDEVLPWEIIDPLIDREFLKRENEKAKAAQVTHDCRLGCVGCGMNKHTKCFHGADEDMLRRIGKEAASG
ncbi:MAG: TIGR03960 family B12-binding radical SAM protein [Bacillota bacterium]|nr:TIGR03960 family B12-binding radical SAM protein [Bacillota bacterium]